MNRSDLSITKYHRTLLSIFVGSAVSNSLEPYLSFNLNFESAIFSGALWIKSSDILRKDSVMISDRTSSLCKLSTYLLCDTTIGTFQSTTLRAILFMFHCLEILIDRLLKYEQVHIVIPHSIDCVMLLWLHKCNEIAKCY